MDELLLVSPRNKYQKMVNKNDSSLRQKASAMWQIRLGGVAFMRTSMIFISIGCGCFTASSIAKSVTTASPFEVIQYKLPSADISMKIGLTLESCNTVPVVSAEVALSADASASPQAFSLTSSQLESARIKRTVNISLQDTGTIATINSSVEDRTGSIAGNVVKFLASILGAVVRGGSAPATSSVPATSGAAGTSTCNSNVLAAIQRVAQIDNALEKWRNVMPVTIGKAADEQHQAMEALTEERSSLRIGILHVDLVAPLDFAEITTATEAHQQTWTAETDVDPDNLAKSWLTSQAAPPKIVVTWNIQPMGGASPPTAGALPVDLCQRQLASIAGQGICFAIPAPVKFTATAQAFGLTIVNSVAQLKTGDVFPVPQWGKFQMLGLSAGFGANRQLSLTLDKFGRTSSMNWTSEAKLETATAGLAGVAGQVTDFANVHSRTARDKAELEDLTTQQSLNRMRVCREILAAGGSACPAEANTNLQE